MFCVAWDYSSSNLKDRQYKQKTSQKSYKTQIKFLANPVLANRVLNSITLMRTNSDYDVDFFFLGDIRFQLLVLM